MKTFENLVSEGRTLLSIDDPSAAQSARLRFLEHNLPQLSESISRTRRTNYLNDQSLFQIHNVAIRLDVALMLMSGLPELPNQCFSECSYFFRAMHRHLCSLEFGITAYEDIHARLCALEKQTVRAFIKIIKGDAIICGLPLCRRHGIEYQSH